MIASEFLDHLKTIRHLFRWKLVHDNLRIPERRQEARFGIRATKPGLPDDVMFEPIGAVCFIETGKVYGPEAWIDSAEAIQLSLMDAGDLTAAINGETWDHKDGSRNPSSYRDRLRDTLLASTDLRPTKT